MCPEERYLSKTGREAGASKLLKMMSLTLQPHQIFNAPASAQNKSLRWGVMTAGSEKKIYALRLTCTSETFQQCGKVEANNGEQKIQERGST